MKNAGELVLAKANFAADPTLLVDIQHLMAECSALQRQLAEVRTLAARRGAAIHSLLSMPEFDGSKAAAVQRLTIKREARAAAVDDMPPSVLGS